MQSRRRNSRTALVLTTAVSIVASLGCGALLSGANAAGATARTASAPTIANRPAVPARGALFGAAVSGRPGADVKTSVTTLESEIGRKFDIHRLYDVWDDQQPTAITSWTASQGRTPVLSIKATRRNGTVVRWADIAAGREDSQIRAQARGLKALNVPLFLALHHEPEDDPGHGTPAAYVAAWRHYVSVFRSEGATNVSFTWILMAWSFEHPSIANSFYPGDDVIDWVAADGYNWYGAVPGKAWRPLADALAAFAAWDRPHAKPMMVSEYGSLEDPAVPGRKAAWIAQTAAGFKTMPAIKAVLYFHAPVVHPWWVDSSPSALSAFAAMGRDPYYHATGSSPAAHTVADFDGNGTTDLAVYRPGNGSWYIRNGRSVAWGRSSDLPVPADYNGDGRTDIAVYRPTNTRWYISGTTSIAYGTRGDIPVPADYNGD
ncbi:MAG: hypothetical protein ABJC62_14045, partial [Frankiaceae bacterium]